MYVSGASCLAIKEPGAMWARNTGRRSPNSAIATTSWHIGKMDRETVQEEVDVE
jgi:hypothetical protein